MKRDQFLRRLRSYAKAHELTLSVDRKRGKGSHIRVFLGDRFTFVPDPVRPGMLRAVLRQLGVDEREF